MIVAVCRPDAMPVQLCKVEIVSEMLNALSQDNAKISRKS